MYNYNYNVSYKNIEGDASETKYRKDVLTVFNLEYYEDIVLDKQDIIFNKFKNNKKFIEIFEKAKVNGKIELFKTYKLPHGCLFEYNYPNILICFFSYEYFEAFHLCLQDLFKTNDISDANFIKITNLLS